MYKEAYLATSAHVITPGLHIRPILASTCDRVGAHCPGCIKYFPDIPAENIRSEVEETSTLGIWPWESAMLPMAPIVDFRRYSRDTTVVPRDKGNSGYVTPEFPWTQCQDLPAFTEPHFR